MKALNFIIIAMVVSISCMALVGVTFGIPEFTDWGDKVDMRPFCAINFVMASMLMVVIMNIKRKGFTFIGSMLSSWIVMSCFAGAMLYIVEAYTPSFGLYTMSGINIIEMFPSPITLFSLTAIALLSFIYIMNDERKIKEAKVICFIIGLLGVSSFAGHLLDIPALYFYVKEINNGIAMPTSIALILTSVFFFMNLSPDIKIVDNIVENKSYSLP